MIEIDVSENEEAEVNINIANDPIAGTSANDKTRKGAKIRICRPHSKFKNFFEYENTSVSGNKNEKIAKCILCKNKRINTQIKMKQSNTTGLRRHLLAKHREESQHLFIKSSSSSTSPGSNNVDIISESEQSGIIKFLNSGSTQKSQTTQVRFDEIIVDWIAAKYLPFNFFDDAKSQELFKFLNSNIIVPKRTILHQKVTARYEILKSSIGEILKNNNSNISFTIDGWTSISNKSFYGITAHFIDENWVLQSLVLDFLPSHGHHSGKDIANLFLSVIQENQIEHKIQGITTDNAAANTTFMQELGNLLQESNIEFNVQDRHFRCFAHILNLAVHDILKLIKAEPNEDADSDEENMELDVDENETAVNKIRKLFLKFKRSEQWCNKLKSCCDTTNINFINPIIDVSTRWNSTNDMIKIALALKPAINAICGNNENLKKFKISEIDWNLLEETYKILKHFKALSTALGGEEYVTLPIVIIGFNILLDKLEKEIFFLDNKEDRTSTDVKLIKAYSSGRDKLIKYYAKTNWIYCIVLILDPRHKLETFNLTTWGKELLNASNKKFEEIYKTNYYQPPTREVSPCKDNIRPDEEGMDLTELFECKKPISENWSNEITLYCQSKREDKHTDILLWWKDHALIYPSLAKMAKDFLCTPATSVPSERIFSKAGLVIRKQRNRLSADSARALLCLNSWCTNKIYDEIKNNKKLVKE